MSAIFKTKQRAVVKLSDGTKFQSGTVAGAKNAATKYARSKGFHYHGSVEFVSRTGTHIQYPDQWFK